MMQGRIFGRLGIWLRAIVVASVGLLGISLPGGAADRGGSAGGFMRLTAAQVRWETVPDGFGAQIATLAGDPSKPGLYVQRVKFPPHVMTRPHWHPGDRYVTVLEGTWFAGTGPTFDPALAIAMQPGSFMFHPAKALHWDGSNSDQQVIVQVVGLGPLDTVPAAAGQPTWIRLPR